jgi:hypothetical protein
MVKYKNFDIKPDWSEIEQVRDQSLKFFEAIGIPDGIVHSLTMVISELLENSIKYGIYAGPADKATARIDITPHSVIIQVKNPIGEQVQNHLANLDKTIQWIRGFQDPFEAYIERIKEVAKRSLTDEESGLGLVRIAYEGDAILDFFVDDDNILNVSAISKMEKPITDV